jgi:hypothetical protein
MATPRASNYHHGDNRSKSGSSGADSRTDPMAAMPMRGSSSRAIRIGGQVKREQVPRLSQGRKSGRQGSMHEL